MDSSKLMTMKDAVSKYIKDGDTVYLAGFTHMIPFAAGHEIIRQRRKDLTLCRATPDIVYDQMIAAGCAKKVVFSYAGNPGVGSLRCFRRALEKGVPKPIEIDEYTHFGLSGQALRRRDEHAVPADEDERWLRPAVVQPEHEDGQGPVHRRRDLGRAAAQSGRRRRARPEGRHERERPCLGHHGEQKDAAFASKKVILTCEEIVGEDIIRSDPNRTLIPDFVVHAVVHEPWCAHPSYTQGYYDRDNEFYMQWDDVTKEHESTMKYLDEWVYGVEDRKAYMKKLPGEKILKLLPKAAYSAPVNYGSV